MVRRNYLGSLIYTGAHLGTCTGHIAKLLGMPRHSRHVGNGNCHILAIHQLLAPPKLTNKLSVLALKFLPEDTEIPWQRVIGSSGERKQRRIRRPGLHSSAGANP